MSDQLANLPTDNRRQTDRRKRVRRTTAEVDVANRRVIERYEDTAKPATATVPLVIAVDVTALAATVVAWRLAAENDHGPGSTRVLNALEDAWTKACPHVDPADIATLPGGNLIAYTAPF